MTITIRLRTGNAAFQDNNYDTEVSRLLQVIADRASEYGRRIDGRLLDINGNHVGDVKVTGN